VVNDETSVELWTIRDIAAYLRITTASVRKLIALSRAGRGGANPFPHEPVPGTGIPFRWPAEQIRAYAAARPGRGSPGRPRGPRRRAA
jgi:hypothetical protein